MPINLASTQAMSNQRMYPTVPISQVFTQLSHIASSESVALSQHREVPTADTTPRCHRYQSNAVCQQITVNDVTYTDVSTRNTSVTGQESPPSSPSTALGRISRAHPETNSSTCAQSAINMHRQHHQERSVLFIKNTFSTHSSQDKVNSSWRYIEIGTLS